MQGEILAQFAQRSHHIRGLAHHEADGPEDADVLAARQAQSEMRAGQAAGAVLQQANKSPVGNPAVLGNRRRRDAGTGTQRVRIAAELADQLIVAFQGRRAHKVVVHGATGVIVLWNLGAMSRNIKPRFR